MNYDLGTDGGGGGAESKRKNRKEKITFWYHREGKQMIFD